MARHIVAVGGQPLVNAAGLMLAGSVLEGIGLACFLPLISLITGGGGGWLQAGIDRGFGLVRVGDTSDRLLIVIAAFTLVMLLRAAILAWRDRMLTKLQIDFVEHERLRLLETLAGSSWTRVAALKHARITNALGSDIARIAAATQLLMQSSVSLVMLAGQWTIALLIAPRLAGVVLVLLVGLLLITHRSALRGAIRFGTRQGTGNLGLMNTAAQLLGGLKPAFAQNMQSAFIAEFAETARALAVSQLAYQVRQSRMRLGIATGIAVAGAVALLAGQRLGIQPAALLTTLAIFSRMTTPVSLLVQNALLIATQLPAHTALETLLAELGPPAVDHANRTEPMIEGALVFDDVDYTHDDGGGVAGLSFRIGDGEIVGLMGPSGAGKTTLVDLLAGLLMPQRGTIRIGTTPIDERSTAPWRSRIAYVAQEPYLFHATIRRNLAWGSPETDDEALWQALALAEAEALVRRMANGLDTIVGERGTRLSGGERQRISLARALLRRPTMLILDEATNAVDIATERAILEQLAALRARPTILLIAHRAETLAICDRVITLEHGRIVSDCPATGFRNGAVAQTLRN